MKVTWAAWLDELKKECLRIDYPLNTSAGAEEAWRGYYSDDYTPLEAIREDASYQ